MRHLALALLVLLAACAGCSNDVQDTNPKLDPKTKVDPKIKPATSGNNQQQAGAKKEKQ